MVEVRWTNSAMRDLQATHEYAAVSSPAYADRLINRLIGRTRILESFPEASRMVPEFNNPVLRELPERNYRLVYRIRSATRIDIVRVHPSAMPLRPEDFTS